MTVLENLRGRAADARSSPRARPPRSPPGCSATSASTVDPRDRVETLTVAQRHLLEIAKAFAVSPEAAHPRRAHRPARRRRRRAVLPAGARAGRRRHLGRLHHPPHGRGARARRPGDRAPRRPGARHLPGHRHHRRRAARASSSAASSTPPSRPSTCRARTTRRACELDGPRRARASPGCRRRSTRGRDRRARRRRRQRPEPACCARWPASSRSPAPSTVGGQALRSPRAAAPGGVHAGGPALRGADDEPLACGRTPRSSALQRFTSGPFVSRRRESAAVGASLASLSVRAPSTEAPVSALSGGNQQKVVISRALLSEPVLLLADEPTQGVDVGARAEIYGILREASGARRPGRHRLLRRQGARGALRRGARHVARARRGDAARRRRSPRSGWSARRSAPAPRRSSVPEGAPAGRSVRGLRRFIRATTRRRRWSRPIIVLLGGVLLARRTARYLSDFNVSNLLTAATALGFIALGQNIALLTGGIDLSVGPLAGFLVVVASFFVNDGKPAPGAARARPDARRRRLRRADQRLAHPVRQVHPDRRDARALHRLRRVRAAAAAGRRAATSPSRFQDAVNYSIGPIPVAFVLVRRGDRRAWSCSCAAGAGAGGCGRSARTRRPRAASAST